MPNINTFSFLIWNVIMIYHIFILFPLLELLLKELPKDMFLFKKNLPNIDS